MVDQLKPSQFLAFLRQEGQHGRTLRARSARVSRGVWTSREPCRRPSDSPWLRPPFGSTITLLTRRDNRASPCTPGG